MGAVISALVGLLTGKAGEKIGGAVSLVAQLGALIAAIAPIALWLQGHRGETFIEVTYGDLAFWGPIIGVLVFVIVRLVHRAAPPA